MSDNPLRPESEIAAAHDRLTAIVLGEVPWPFDNSADNAAVIAALDVLCWVLRHDHNVSFAENLDKIDAFLLDHGFVLERKPDGEV